MKIENFLKVTQLDHKIKYIGENKTVTDSIEKNRKEFIRNNKLILKRQPRFKSESHNVFSEEINNIAFKFNWQ